jgi:hypothetical protein
MYSYFYHFHNRKLGDDLFNRFDEEGSPPAPPILFALLDNDGNDLLDNNSAILTDNG